MGLLKVTFGDTETTGLDPEKGHRICEIALLTVHIDPEKVQLSGGVDTFSKLINPMRGMPAEVTAIHGITAGMVMHEPSFRSLAISIGAQMEDSVLVMHNAPFDMKFIESEFKLAGLPMPRLRAVYDSCGSMRVITPEGKKPNLGELCWAYDVPYGKVGAHRADYDTKCLMLAVLRAMRSGDIDFSHYLETKEKAA